MKADYDRQADPNWLIVWELYRGMCVHCRGRATGIHELTPKAHRVDWWVIENRVPLCRECHEWAQVQWRSKIEQLTLEAKDLLEFLKV